jgi:hypothetical protein
MSRGAGFGSPEGVRVPDGGRTLFGMTVLVAGATGVNRQDTPEPESWWTPHSRPVFEGW